MVNVGVIGYGFVGKATAYIFKDKNNVKFYDPVVESPIFKEVTKSPTLEELVSGAEFLFICLPTPFDKKKEEIDLEIIDASMKDITEHTDNTNKIIVIKSTVIPTTTRNYSKLYPRTNFCFNPEFLTEANYLQDASNPDRIIIGADNDDVSLRVTELYRSRFPENVKLYRTDPTSAEIVKYAANGFLATKVIFANVINLLCEKLEVSWPEIKEMVAADPRIGSSHLDVTSQKGFGGKCFPKDLVALIGLYRKLGLDASLLESVWNINLKIRRVRDWENIPGAVSTKPHT